MTEVRIHYEGDPQLREGFHQFFRELTALARARRCRVRFIAGKGRSDTIQYFRDAIESHSSAWNVLLIDSKGSDLQRASSASKSACFAGRSVKGRRAAISGTGTLASSFGSSL